MIAKVVWYKGANSLTKFILKEMRAFSLVYIVSTEFINDYYVGAREIIIAAELDSYITFLGTWLSKC
jgi:hypothetical protein